MTNQDSSDNRFQYAEGLFADHVTSLTYCVVGDDKIYGSKSELVEYREKDKLFVRDLYTFGLIRATHIGIWETFTRRRLEGLDEDELYEVVDNQIKDGLRYCRLGWVDTYHVINNPDIYRGKRPFLIHEIYLNVYGEDMVTFHEDLTKYRLKERVQIYQKSNGNIQPDTVGFPLGEQLERMVLKRFSNLFTNHVLGFAPFRLES